MVVPFMITAESSLVWVAIQVYWLLLPFSLWYMDADYFCSINIHYFHIAVSQDIFIHFFTTERIPKIFDNFVGIVRAYNLKPFTRIFFTTILVYTEQNSATKRIGKRRISFPN